MDQSKHRNDMGMEGCGGEGKIKVSRDRERENKLHTHVMNSSDSNYR